MATQYIVLPDDAIASSGTPSPREWYDPQPPSIHPELSVIPSLRSLRVLALAASAACATTPTFAPSSAPLRRGSLAPSTFAVDSLDVLQCAQRVGASGGFFVDDTTGTVLVRRPGTSPDRLRTTVPVRRPGAVPVETPGALAVQPRSTRQVRILLRPRAMHGWARVNARAPGNGGASTRELVQLMNARCMWRRTAD